MGRRGAGKPRVDLETLDATSTKIYRYYSGVLGEEELKLWTQYMVKPLPTTFRMHGINGDLESSAIYRDLFIDRFARRLSSLDVRDDTEENENVEMPHPIPWYPDQLAWQMDIPRKAFRKIPALKDLRSFIIQQHDEGFITRQEAVSMIPPFFLNIGAGNKILDMCAAPGSKTTQLVDMLHEANKAAELAKEGRETAKDESSPLTDDLKWTKLPKESLPKEVSTPRGLVVANDLDLSRCFMLVRNVCRLTSPSLVVTNNNSMKYPEAVGADGGVLKYDRILADVPCSGDGTIRKSPDLWKSWDPSSAATLHNVQLKIAQRGAHLLAVGGRMVYSTCSLNPIEDEAVVSHLIKSSGGALRIVDPKTDPTNPLPNLGAAPGLSTWRVMDPKTNVWYKSQEEVPSQVASRVVGTMFPCGIDLSGCMRVYPWPHNNGGFFVTVIEKVAELPEDLTPETTVPNIKVGEEVKSTDENNTEIEQEGKVHVPIGASKEPWHELPLVPVEEDVMRSVYKQFGVPEGCLPPGLAMTRSQNTIYRITMMTPDSAAFVCGAAFADIAAGSVANSAITEEHTRLRVVNAGLLVLERKQGGTDSLHSGGEKLDSYWRVPQAAGKFVPAFCATRFIGTAPYSVILRCLEAGIHETEPISQMVRFGDPFWETDPAASEFLERVKQISLDEFRGAAWVLAGGPRDKSNISRLIENGLFLTCWVGAASFGLHITRRLKSTLHQLVGNETTSLDINRKKQVEPVVAPVEVCGDEGKVEVAKSDEKTDEAKGKEGETQ